jgi:hypothetical protein
MGHVGLTATAAKLADRDIDLRWAAFLSVLPDLIDKPIVLLAPVFVAENTRSFGHTALSALALAVVLALLRVPPRRALIYWACYAGHFLFDLMWIVDNPRTLLWPFLGPFPKPLRGGLLKRKLMFYNLAMELAGLAAGVWLARRLKSEAQPR